MGHVTVTTPPSRVTSETLIRPRRGGLSFDVLCCTSSILHLVAISLDRYWAVTRVDYIHNRSAARILLMVALSWTLSAVISVPPLFGAGDPRSDPDATGICAISHNRVYAVFSTVCAFYLPLKALSHRQHVEATGQPVARCFGDVLLLP